MNACPEEIILYMHEYLDQDLPREKEQVLKEHLQQCPSCQKHFQELKRTDAYIYSSALIKPSANFTSNVLANLPKEKNSTGVKRWFRHHPLLTAAALFLVLMTGSVFSIYNEDQKFSFTKQPNLIVENNTVIVPEGEVVQGDITVKNGDLRIEGEVDGNVTIINGEKYQASAGNVTGDIEEINQIFDWLWYKIKAGGAKVIDVFQSDSK